MGSSNSLLGLLALLLVFAAGHAAAACASTDINCAVAAPMPNAMFYKNYYVTFGGNHVSVSRTQVQLSITQASGSGFASRSTYIFGFFTMKIKMSKAPTGIIITLYLASEKQYTEARDELDFEFLAGPTFVLQTNVFANDLGGREQKKILPFDPTADFHNYSILWNQKQIVFFVDDTPIRVFRNNTNVGFKKYPSTPMMLKATIWQGDWVLPKGAKMNWRNEPFFAQYKGFKDIDACPPKGCQPTRSWWNQKKYWSLTPLQEKRYKNVQKSLVYNYCTDKKRYPRAPPECKYNQ